MAKNFSLKIQISLASIILLGFILRAYNIDFPSIGYHNMKENEYLSIAQEMKKTQDFISRRVYFYHAFEDAPKMKIYPQVPMIAYQTLIAWQFFGENIWGPRLINVIFGILSIIIIYLIANLLFDNAALALFSAFLLSIMPLAVFFSRNLQPECPAFFFMLLGSLFYLKFCAFHRKYDLFCGGLFFSIAWIYKSTFIVGIVPFLFCFDFKKIFKINKNTYKLLINFLLPYSLILIAVIWLNLTHQWEFEELKRINLLKIFQPAYWAHEKNTDAIVNYILIENFTVLTVITTLSGVCIAFKQRGFLGRYIIGWGVNIILYSMLFSDYINQHNYYQMPFLLVVCIASAYAILNLAQSLRIAPVKLIIIAALINVPLAHKGIKSMHKYNFYGADIAGETLKELTKPNERVFLYTHCQGYGIARYARRYMEWPDTLEEFKMIEKKFNINYACFFPAIFIMELLRKDPDFFRYIQNNYRLKEIGLLENKKNGKLLKGYFILEKTGNLDSTESFYLRQDKMKLRKIYKIFDLVIPCYSIRPVYKSR